MPKESVLMNFPAMHAPSGHGVYEVYIEGDEGPALVVSLYGSMAAVAAEAVCRYLEGPTDPPKPPITIRDVFERPQVR